MTFKIKRAPRPSDTVDARLYRIAAELKVRRPAMARLFEECSNPMDAMAA